MQIAQVEIKTTKTIYTLSEEEKKTITDCIELLEDLYGNIPYLFHFFSNKSPSCIIDYDECLSCLDFIATYSGKEIENEEDIN